MESEDRARPHEYEGSFAPWEGSPWAQDCLGIMGPGQALRVACAPL